MASTINPPAFMKAWTYTQTGSYRKVLSMTSIPTPKPRDDEVLIKIAYSGLNPGDVKVMTMIPNFMRPKIAIPAIDYSGHIVALGPHAPKDLTPGMPVFGQVDTEAMFKGTGTLAEYVSISASKNMIAPLPENVSLEGAGGLAIGGTMAYCTIQQGSIRPDCGLRILINGASGGCGSAFVQAAKAMGAKEIVATCSAPNFDLVSSLGADRVIDYREHASLPDYLAKEYGARPFDVVYDTVGLQELYTKSPGYLKENGTFLNIGDFTHGTMFTLWYWLINTIWPTWLGGTPRKYVLVRGKTGPEATRWVVENAREGTLKPVIDRAMAFDQVLEAFDIVDSRRARGRVVVRVAE